MTDTDAPNWFARRSGRWPWVAGLTFLFLLPALSGVIGRLVGGKPVVGAQDFAAVACAAEKSANGEPLYPPADQFACEGMDAANYLYTPWLADLIGQLYAVMDYPALFTAYHIVFWPLLAASILVPIYFARSQGTRLERASFLGFATGSVFYWSNVAGILLGLVALAGLVTRIPVLLGLAILLAGWVKPTYLSLLAFILFLDIGIAKRIGMFIAAVLIGLAPTLHFFFTGGDTVTEWRDLLAYIGAAQGVGGGFFGWFDTLGMGFENPLPELIGYFPFAALMLLSGIAVAERWIGETDTAASDRIWLGLAVGNLLNPRLLGYDLFLFAPGLVALIYLSRASDRTLLGKPLTNRLTWLTVGAACLVTFMNVADMGDYAVPVGTVLMAIAVLVAGLPEIRPALREKLGL